MRIGKQMSLAVRLRASDLSTLPDEPPKPLLGPEGDCLRPQKPTSLSTGRVTRITFSVNAAWSAPMISSTFLPLRKKLRQRREGPMSSAASATTSPSSLPHLATSSVIC